jgi:uncharacterized protein YdhG (YjbR/CyaY superfamily)
MKQIYTLLALIVLSSAAFAGRPVITLIDEQGSWKKANDWSLNRVPQDGDSVVIPKGYEVIMDRDMDLSDIKIYVAGTLEMKNVLALDKTSEVIVASTGIINRFGARPGNEVITIGGVKKYDEKSNNIIGFAVASKNTSVSPAGFSAALILPVKFSSFYANRSGQNILLSWTTEIESDNSHFNIQRSVDGINWSGIAIMMGNGNTSTTKSYSYTDKNVQGAVIYYRLHQVDANGNATYSSVRVVRSNEENNSTTVYASSKQTIAVDFNKQISNNMVIRVFNGGGQIVAEQKIQSSSYKISVPVANAAAGIYVVQIADNNGFSETKRVML